MPDLIRLRERTMKDLSMTYNQNWHVKTSLACLTGGRLELGQERRDG
jgi:hypothetical protein